MFFHLNVATQNSGATMNIPFEQRAENVVDYSTDFWQLSKDGGKTYPHLVYTQAITMRIASSGFFYFFPRVTCNCITKMP